MANKTKQKPEIHISGTEVPTANLGSLTTASSKNKKPLAGD